MSKIKQFFRYLQKLPSNLLKNFYKQLLGKNFWKNYFKVYDTLNESPSYQLLLQTIVKNSNLSPHLNILDAGCGTGNLIPFLKNYNINYTGIDIIDEALDIARKKAYGLSNFKIFNADISKPLPFQDNSFDRIICNNVIYILNDSGRISALKELFRVLKPNGLLIVSTLKNGFSPKKIYLHSIRMGRKNLGLFKSILKTIKFILPAIKILFYNQIINAKQKRGSYKYFSRQELKSLLSSSGFDIITSRLVYSGQAILVVAKK